MQIHQRIVDNVISKSMMSKHIDAPAYPGSDEKQKDRHEIYEKMSSAASDKKRRRTEMSEEERKEERRAANRRSAFESRMRRRILIEDLQQTVQNLSKENATIRREADSLRLQLESLLKENRQLRMQQEYSHSHRFSASQIYNPHPFARPSILDAPVAPGLWQGAGEHGSGLLAPQFGPASNLAGTSAQQGGNNLGDFDSLQPRVRSDPPGDDLVLAEQMRDHLLRDGGKGSY